MCKQLIEEMSQGRLVREEHVAQEREGAGGPGQSPAEGRTLPPHPRAPLSMSSLGFAQSEEGSWAFALPHHPKFGQPPLPLPWEHGQASGCCCGELGRVRKPTHLEKTHPRICGRESTSTQATLCSTHIHSLPE